MARGKGLTAAQIQELVGGLAVTVEPIGRLQEYAGNAKEHTAEQVGQIKESMRQVGFCDPIGVWTNAEGKSEVVEGHGRLMAALELGLESVPVIHLDGLSDEQRRFYALVHNQLTMSTGWDFGKLDAELRELSDFDMADFGFEDIELLSDDDVEITEDEPDEEAEDRVRTGELWRMGGTCPPVRGLHRRGGRRPLDVGDAGSGWGGGRRPAADRPAVQRRARPARQSTQGRSYHCQ